MKKVLLIFTIFIFLWGCSKGEENNIINIYCSVDEVFAKKLFRDFQKKTNIRVKPLFDTEATKSVGLFQRILMEKSSNKADLFLNSEFISTLRLKKLGLVGDYIPFGKRERVFVINTKKILKKDYPSHFMDLTNPKYKGKVAISNPLFGTTFVHFLYLYKVMGKINFIHFLKALKKNNVAVVSGNSVVKDLVSSGKYLFGLVDIDDVNVGIKNKEPLKAIYYDQDKEGVFEIFGTIAILKNAKNKENILKFIKYIKKDGENLLIKLGAFSSKYNQKNNFKTIKINKDDIDFLVKLIPSYKRLIRKYLL